MTEIRDSQSTVVVVGKLNPWIIQPAWLREHKIISQNEFEASAEKSGQLIHSDVTQLDFGALKLVVDTAKFTVTCIEEPFVRAKDFALGCFRLLSHTPASLLGLNKNVTVRLPSMQAWHKFGDLLAPKDPWSALLDIVPKQGRVGGLRSMIMELSTRPDELNGYVRVQIDALSTGQPDISVQVNDHIVLHTDGKEADGARVSAVIDQCWHSSMARADKIVSDLMKKVQ